MQLKKLTPFFLFPVLFLALTVSAQTSTRPNVIGQEMRQQAEQTRANLQQQLETKKALRNELQAERRTALTERLSVVRDERKRQIALRIHDQFNQINARLTGHFSNLTDRQEEILDRLITRINEIEADGFDVTEARNNVVQVEDAIERARDAILTQSAKIYQIEVETEEALGGNIGALRQEIGQDLQTVRQTVRDIREALRLTVTSLARTMTETETRGEEAETDLDN